MRAAMTMTLLWCGLALAGCSLANDPTPVPLAVPVEFTRERCPEPSAADRKQANERVKRPWNAIDGAKLGDMKTVIDKQEVLIEKLAGVVKRAHRELDRCRGDDGPPST